MTPHTPAEAAILRRITPPGEDARVRNILRKTEDALLQAGLPATVMLGGSTAKGTYLAGDHDVDMFIRFDPDEVRGEELPDLLEPALKRAFPRLQRVHGSRDYFQADAGAYHLEFIPVLHVASWQHAENVTDMSPLHVEYVAHKISERPHLAGEIRLLKQFCKAAKVYGAESYLSGFSGYMVELLVLGYGGFRETLKAAARWKVPVTLDPEKHHADARAVMNIEKTRSPLVLVDPVQPDRNAAAALSQERFLAFKQAAADYLKAPAKGQAAFFRIIPFSPKSFVKEHKGQRVLVIAMRPLPGKKDVSGSKCQKVLEHVLRRLDEQEFQAKGSAWEFTPTKAVACVAVPKGLLPATRDVQGPPLKMKEACAHFRNAHKDVRVVRGRLLAREPRAFRDPLACVKAALRDPYVKERVRSATVKGF